MYDQVYLMLALPPNYSKLGKGKESDPTDECWPTRWLTHHRHTTKASVDTIPMRRPTYHRQVGQHTTDTLIKNKTFSNCYFVTSFSWKQERLHKKGRKHES